MSEIESREFPMKRWVRNLVLAVAGVMAVVCVWAIFDEAAAGDYGTIAFINIPSLVVPLLITANTWRRRITLTDTHLISIGIRTRMLPLQSVSKLVFRDLGVLVVKGPGLASIGIELTKDLCDWQELKRLVIERVRSNPGLKVRGDKKMIEAHFGPGYLDSRK